MTTGPVRSGCAAASDQRRLRAVRMPVGDLLNEPGLGRADIGQRLTGLRSGKENHEINRMAGSERHADLRVALKPADPRPVTGPRIDNDERPLRFIDLRAVRRSDADERVIDWPVQLPAVEDDRVVVDQERRLAGPFVLEPVVSPLSNRVPEQHAALHGVNNVGGPFPARDWQRAGGQCRDGVDCFLHHARRELISGRYDTVGIEAVDFAAQLEQVRDGLFQIGHGNRPPYGGATQTDGGPDRARERPCDARSNTSSRRS
jgi:hypothetical protein